MSGEHRVALNHPIWGSNPPSRTKNKNKSYVVDYFKKVTQIFQKEEKFNYPRSLLYTF
jgi:hypothetical protein